jgi:hypothetical protein
MKKFAIIVVVCLLGGTLMAQSLEKGDVVALHTMSIQLDPDATLNQYLDVLVNSWMPEIVKAAGDIKGYVLHGDRGAGENRIGVVWIFPSVAVRNKYFPGNGETPEAWQAIMDKIAPINDKLEGLGSWTSEYTDWIVK